MRPLLLPLLILLAGCSASHRSTHQQLHSSVADSIALFRASQLNATLIGVTFHPDSPRVLSIARVELQQRDSLAARAASNSVVKREVSVKSKPNHVHPKIALLSLIFLLFFAFFVKKFGHSR